MFGIRAPTVVTNKQYKHRVIFALDGSRRGIFTMNDRITID